MAAGGRFSSAWEIAVGPIRVFCAGVWLVAVGATLGCGTTEQPTGTNDTFIFVTPDASVDAKKDTGTAPDVVADIADLVSDLYVPPDVQELPDVEPDAPVDIATPDTGTVDVYLPQCVTDVTCDDADQCTVDICSNEKCKNTPIPGCCKVESDCPVAGPCKAAKCIQNVCKVETVADCCASGPCCDAVTQQAKPVQAICTEAAADVEFSCSGSDIYGRKAKLGCDGVSTAACSGDPADLNWTEWLPVASCTAGGLCQKPADKHLLPVCSGGAPSACVNDIGCDDADPCTDDLCKSGTCSHPLAPASTLCGKTPTFVEYSCLGGSGSAEAGGAVVTRSQVASCGNLGKCDGKSGWTPWIAQENCLQTEKCDVPISTEPGSCVPIPVCKPGQTCCTGTSQWQPAGTPCGNTTVVSEYKCESTTAKGAKFQVRHGVAGCAGTSGACNAANPSWGNWQPAGQCLDNQLCTIAAPGTPPTCVDVCQPGTTCCTLAGDFASQGFKCANLLQKAVTTCTVSGGVDTIIKTDLFPGCTGVDSTCSTAAADLAKSSATILKQCQSYEKCVQVGDNATCELSAPCAPGTQCCTADGQWAPVATPCLPAGTTQYSCSSNQPGAAVEKRDVFYGCSGYSKECSYEVSDFYYSPWTTSKDCEANEVCLASADLTFADCNSTYQCLPGSVCCTVNGKFMPAATPCGQVVAKTEYKCSDANLGGSILKKEYVAGCLGTSADCSSAQPDLVNYPPGWLTKVSCQGLTYCHVDSLADPGFCSAAPP